MARLCPLRAPRYYLASAGLLAALTAITLNVSIRADEAELLRAEFQDCPDVDAHPALDDVHSRQRREATHPRNRNSATFYYIADVERCPGSRTVSVRHTVKNLHSTDRLPFQWDGTFSSHAGLLPGDACCDPVKWFPYNEQPFASRIMYGVSLDYPVPAAIYPLPTRTADAQEALTVGDVLVSKIETRYIDAGGKLRQVSVELTSAYTEDNLISYTFTREPAGLVLALGGLSESPAGERIATSLSADVGRLEDFLVIDDLNKLPIVLLRKNSWLFLLIQNFLNRYY